MDKKYLENINIVISELEDAQLFKEAEDLHNLFMKTAGKKKKSKGKNVPNDPALYSRCKSEAKRKFDVWPSAYGSAYLVKLYKSKGGTFRKSNSDNNVKLGQQNYNIEPERMSDLYSGYLEMSYDDVVKNAKEWIESGRRYLAYEMITTVIKNSKELTPQQKNDLSNIIYKDVITKAKDLVFNGQIEGAKTFIQTVIESSDFLNDPQKKALQKQFNIILGVYGDTKFEKSPYSIPFKGQTLNQQYEQIYNYAQGLLSQIEGRSYEQKIKAIKDYELKKYPIFSRLVRQFAFNQLRREQMENKQR